MGVWHGKTKILGPLFRDEDKQAWTKASQWVFILLISSLLFLKAKNVLANYHVKDIMLPLLYSLKLIYTLKSTLLEDIL